MCTRLVADNFAKILQRLEAFAVHSPVRFIKIFFVGLCNVYLHRSRFRTYLCPTLIILQILQLFCTQIYTLNLDYANTQSGYANQIQKNAYKKCSDCENLLIFGEVKLLWLEMFTHWPWLHQYWKRYRFRSPLGLCFTN